MPLTTRQQGDFFTDEAGSWAYYPETAIDPDLYQQFLALMQGENRSMSWDEYAKALGTTTQNVYDMSNMWRAERGRTPDVNAPNPMPASYIPWLEHPANPNAATQPAENYEKPLVSSSTRMIPEQPATEGSRARQPVAPVTGTRGALPATSFPAPTRGRGAFTGTGIKPRQATAGSQIPQITGAAPAATPSGVSPTITPQYNSLQEWNAAQEGAPAQVDPLAQAQALLNQNFQPGTLSLAQLLGQTTPTSWLQPGASYGDIGWNGTPTGRVSYWNETGRPFTYGQDERGYWYNIPQGKWQMGDVGTGEVQETNILPWMQVPWTVREFGSANPNYYNEEGNVWMPGDESAYWFNAPANLWERGDLTGNVSQIAALPWRGGGGQGSVANTLREAAGPPASPMTEEQATQLLDRQQTAMEQWQQWQAILQDPAMLQLLQQYGMGF